MIELESQQFPRSWLRSQFEVVSRLEGEQISLLSTPFAIQDFKDEHILETRFSKIKALSLSLTSKVAGVAVNFQVGLSSGAAATIQFSIINNIEENLSLEQISPLLIQSGDLHLGKS